MKEINIRNIRIPEDMVMRRKETSTILDGTISTKELENITCSVSAASSSVGSHCWVLTSTIEEPVYMVEEELKTDFYFWIRNADKLLLDRKCKP